MEPPKNGPRRGRPCVSAARCFPSTTRPASRTSPGPDRVGFRIYASGGTARTLAAAGIDTVDVATLVGGAAILGHRVVTLSREVHAGLLARPVPEDLAELDALGVPFIDLVCVDLYPLTAEIGTPDATPHR